MSFIEASEVNVRYSYLNVGGQPNSDADNHCLKLGYAAAVMAMSPRHAGWPVAYLRTVVAEAIRQDRIKFYFNQDGRLVGYAIWAHLSRQAEAALAKGGFAQFRREDWNSGDTPWIVDFAAPQGNLKYMLHDLRDDIFKDEARVRYFRLKNNRRIFKQLDRDMHCAFIRAGAA